MAEAIKSVVRLDRCQSIYFGGGHIHSVVKADTELENGMIGVLGDFLAGERELRELKAPTGTGEKVVLIAHPEVRYEEYRRSDNSLQKFFQKEGEPTRAYDLASGDIISISKEGVVALDAVGNEVVVGNYLVAEAGSLRLHEVASVVGTEKFVAKIIAKEKLGTSTVVGEAGTIARVIDLVVFEIIKNEA